MNPIPVTVLPVEGESVEKGERALWVAFIPRTSNPYDDDAAVVVGKDGKPFVARLSLLVVSPEWLACDGLPSGALVSVTRRPL